MVLHLATTGAEEVQQRHVLCAVVAVGTLGAVGGGQRVPREPRRRAGEDSPKKKILGFQIRQKKHLVIFHRS